MIEPAVGVIGATGRLGTAILKYLEGNGIRVVLTASAKVGWQGDRVPDVLVDASSPTAWRAVSGYCRRHRVALVECVSNLSARQCEELSLLAQRVPVVRATNLALGNHIQRQAVTWLATLLRPLADQIEATVWERHPTTKVHEPSATATELAELWTGAAISSRRSGLPVSEHEFTLTLPGQTFTLHHHVSDLSAAAAGALAALHWTTGRAPGLSTMDEVYDDMFAMKGFGA